MAIGTEEGTPAKSQKAPSNSPEMAGTMSCDNIPGQCPYVFMSNSYHGSGGYRNGRYLVPHQSERKMFFERRQQMAHYKNYVKPIVRAMIDPVFNAEITRKIMVGDTQITDGMLINEFMMDSTGSIKGLHEVINTELTFGRLHGISFLVMDNLPAKLQPQTKEEAIKGRVYPYVYNRTMNTVEDYECDKTGKLLWIMFCDKPVEVAGKKEERYSRWDNMTYRQMGERKVSGNDEYYEIPDTLVEHNLGEIPVIVTIMAEREDNCNLEVDPPLYDVAKIVNSIYNKDSEIRDQERAQAFSILCIQTDTSDSIENGVHNYLRIPNESTNMPTYVSPDAAILAGLVTNNEKLREDLFRIAGQSGVDFRSVAPKSGDALEWEFQAQEVVLKQTAMEARRLEEKIISLFKLYTKEEFDYVSIYPEKFGPSSNSRDLAEIDMVLGMGLPTPAANLLKRMAFQIVTRREDEVEVGKILESFDTLEKESGNQPVETTGNGQA
jgi:hypothetical protein